MVTLRVFLLPFCGFCGLDSEAEGVLRANPTRAELRGLKVLRGVLGCGEAGEGVGLWGLVYRCWSWGRGKRG